MEEREETQKTKDEETERVKRHLREKRLSKHTKQGSTILEKLMQVKVRNIIKREEQ